MAFSKHSTAIKHKLDYIEDIYQERHQVSGITFVSYKPWLPARRYATDDDNAVFTGMYLATASFRYSASGTEVNYQAVLRALAGIHILTHVSKTPGMLARWAFPLAGSWERIGYDKVKSLESETNSYGEHIKAGRLYENEDMGYAFITKTTRDQLSGVLFGLTAAFTYVPRLRPRVRTIINDMYARLVSTGWSLVDHEGKTGTSAHKVDSAQRLLIKALYSAANDSPVKPSSLWFKFISLTTLHYNRIFTRTFSFSLNAMDAHSLFLLRDYHKEGYGVAKWIDRIHSFMKKDNNPYFDALYYVATDEKPSDKSLANLRKRIESEQYPGFFSWQKDPDDWWDTSDTKEGPGIDSMLPYWLLRVPNE